MTASGVKLTENAIRTGLPAREAIRPRDSELRAGEGDSRVTARAFGRVGIMTLFIP
jgi:hypothetical protein